MEVGNTNETGKKSFVLYIDAKELWESLPDAQAGKLIKQVFRYMAGEDPESPDDLTKYLFIQIKSTLDRDQNKWEASKQARSENGKKGGRPPKPKKAIGSEEKLNKAKIANGLGEKLSKANKAVSVTVNANDTVNENEIVDDKLYDVDFLLKIYLANDKLIRAVKEKSEFNGGISLESRLVEFNKFLKAKDQWQKTWKDYTSHFLNWHEKSKKDSTSDSPTFNSPVI